MHSWKKRPNVRWGKICQNSTRPPIDPFKFCRSQNNLLATLRAKTGLKLAVGKERQISLFPLCLGLAQTVYGISVYRIYAVYDRIYTV